MFQTEFNPGNSRNGTPGFTLHVNRLDKDMIVAIHAAAVGENRAQLAKQIERFAEGRVELKPYVPPASETKSAAVPKVSKSTRTVEVE